jgi:phospholipase C
LQYRAAGLVFFLLAASAGIVGCNAGNSLGGSLSEALPSSASSPQVKGNTPISHVVIVIQENRSFDNFFATFPGANGTLTGKAMAMTTAVQTYCGQPSIGQPVITQPATVPLTEVGLDGKGFPNNWDWNQDLAHNYRRGYLTDCHSAASQPNASNPCATDGFDNSYTGPDGEGHPTCTYTYQYVNAKDIQPYWNMAQQYVLADNTFQTQGSESFTAHQDLIAGGTAIDSHDSIIDDPTYWPWGCDAPSGVHSHLLTIYGQYREQGPFPCLSYSTMRDLLDAKKVSWKYYAVKVIGGSAGIWSGFDAISAVRSSKEWGSKVAWPNTKIFSDIKHGHLPAVSWITPNGPNSDHPAEQSDTGPSWVASIVNAIGQSRYWKSSAVVVIWDDWGGFYDHVPPPFYDNQGGLGFRLPMLIVSPYVQAHVEHTQYETTSILRFIEDNWSLGTLGQTDQRATSIANAFNFNQAPRPFKKIAAKYPLEFFLHQKLSDRPPDPK